MTPTLVSFELAGGPYAATAARLAIDGLETRLDGPVYHELRLLVSELVTNSVRHARVSEDDSIALDVAIDEDRVRVEVSDEGPGFDRPNPDMLADMASGWGLFLVERLASRWGIVRDERTRVWFELDRQSPSFAV